MKSSKETLECVGLSGLGFLPNLQFPVLEKVKEVSDKVQPSKNIFGKTTGASMKNSNSLKMPRLVTLQSFLEMNDNQIRSYVAKFHKTAQPTNKPVAAYKQPYDPNLSKTPVAYKQTTPIPQATQPIPITAP